MSWPSFQEARDRQISGAYRARTISTIHVLDRQGAIRYRGFHFCGQVAVAADKLLGIAPAIPLVATLRLKRVGEPISVADTPLIERPDRAAKFEVLRAAIDKRKI